MIGRAQNDVMPTQTPLTMYVTTVNCANTDSTGE